MPLLLARNDITKMTVDAIVNAANPSLLGGGGVDGAIHRAAGPELLAECRTLGGCRTGEARITGAYRLHAQYVIHTVGPIWRGGGCGEEHLLRSCYRRSLELAAAHGCETVAFPLISSGVYGYPKADAFRVAAESVAAFLNDHDLTVYLVLFDRAAYLEADGRLGGVKSFIDDAYAERELKKPQNLYSARWEEPREEAMAEGCDEAPALAPAPGRRERKGASAPKGDLKELLDQLDEGFSPTLLKLIDQKGMTDVACYKRANVSRKLFSKIRSDPRYRPSKTTAVAFALALELTLPETQSLLSRAGFTLSRSCLADVLVEYCIRQGVYDVLAVNELLFEYDQPLLGS